MNGSLRILHVTVSLAPGGMEKVLARVARELTPRGFDFSVACLESSGAVASRLPNPAQVDVLGKGPGLSIRTVFRLRRILNRVRPDVLHTHNFGPLIYGSAATCLGRSVPLLHGEHAQLRPYELTATRRCLRRFLYRGCHAVHTVSGELQLQIRRQGFHARQSINIENGVDCSEYKPGDRALARRRLGLPGNAFVIGSCGRLRPEKRHGWLIEVTDALAGTCPNLYCLIVGDGPQRSALERLRQQSPTPSRILLPGYREELIPYYQAMDLFILPSQLEGLSNAVLEAMGCGIPVLASNACGNGEAIVHGREGWLSPLASVQDLTAEVARLLASPDALRAAGARARERVLADFPFARTVDRYEQVYRATAARGQLPTLEP